MDGRFQGSASVGIPDARSPICQAASGEDEQTQMDQWSESSR